jgi:hypothetical protein
MCVPSVIAERGSEMGRRECNRLRYLGLLIGEIDLAPHGPFHLLGTPERGVYRPCVLREHAPSLSAPLQIARSLSESRRIGVKDSFNPRSISGAVAHAARAELAP